MPFTHTYTTTSMQNDTIHFKSVSWDTAAHKRYQNLALYTPRMSL